MIRYLSSSVFESPAQTLVNTVNTVGVMGKGIAKEFKVRYPDMFEEYNRLCKAGDLTIGSLHLWRSERQWVLNFPTKTTWQRPSELKYIEAGLQKFCATYAELGITSASFPPLGCGNGQLEWSEVQPLMESHLEKIGIPIYIHNMQVAEGFVPEHQLFSHPAPKDFDTFITDLAEVIVRHNGTFETSTRTQYRAAMFSDGKTLRIHHSSGKAEIFDTLALEDAWVKLSENLLTIESFNDERGKRLKGYLFPLLSALPYIKTVKIKPADASSWAKALFLNRIESGLLDISDAQGGSLGCPSL